MYGIEGILGETLEGLNDIKINKIIRKTDFYVGPDGPSSTLPATAYRYLDSKAYVETKRLDYQRRREAARCYSTRPYQ